MSTLLDRSDAPNHLFDIRELDFSPFSAESHPYDLLARTRRQVEAVGHVAPCSHSQPFDTAVRAYSGQAVDLQEATSESACALHADRPGIRVGEYCLVINHLPLRRRGR